MEKCLCRKTKGIKPNDAFSDIFIDSPISADASAQRTLEVDLFDKYSKE